LRPSQPCRIALEPLQGRLFRDDAVLSGGDSSPAFDTTKSLPNPGSRTVDSPSHRTLPSLRFHHGKPRFRPSLAPRPSHFSTSLARSSMVASPSPLLTAVSTSRIKLSPQAAVPHSAETGTRQRLNPQGRPSAATMPKLPPRHHERRIIIADRR
jgi:hypothetical protein